MPTQRSYTHIRDAPCTLEAIHERHLYIHEYEVDVGIVRIRHHVQCIDTVVRDQHLRDAKLNKDLSRQLLVVSGDKGRDP